MKHIIVTGGSGFIGSHLCERLLEKGYAVTAVDNFVTGRKENVSEILGNESFDLYEHDVSESWDLSKMPLLQKHGLHGIYHFACPASPIDFEKIPFEILAVDSAGTAHTVDLALKYDARYLLASTSEIYGDPLVHPQKETYWGNVNTVGPRSCYDEAKRFAEAYVYTAMAGMGSYQGKDYKPLNGAMVRIFNTYGPRMRPDDGRVVPALCTQALSGQPLTVYGDGGQTRSFCFVSDLVEGIMRLFESDLKEPVNIGNPREMKIMDFAQTILKLSNSSSEIKHLESRQDDPKQRCPDITKAKSLLGWEPNVDLEEGLAKTLEHFKKSL